MIPQNRRVAKPAVQPDVLEGLPPEDRAEAEERLAAPPAPKPRPRLIKAVAVAQLVLSVALVVAVAGGLAWSMGRYVRQSPRFALRDIVVTGMKQRTEGEVIERAGLAPGQNVFALDLGDVKARLAADPWLKDVTLTRRLPGTIFVAVVEREAAALVSIGDALYLATRGGEVFKRFELGDPSNLPLVSGLRAELAETDREVLATEVRRALDLVADYTDGPLSSRAPVQQVHVSDDGAMTLIVGKGGLSLAMGRAPYRRRLEQAARVATELERRMGPRALTEKADSILLDNEARPERVIVRMR